MSMGYMKRLEGYNAREIGKGQIICAIRSSLNVILKAMESCVRILIRRVTTSDVSFKELTVNHVLDWSRLEAGRAIRI